MSWSLVYRGFIVNSALAGLEGVDQGGGEGLAAVLVGDQEQPGEVEGDAGAAHDGQHGEPDPDQGGVHAEVVGDPGGHAAQHPVAGGPAQLPPIRAVRAGRGFGGGAGAGGDGVCVHASSLPAGRPPAHREQPRTTPDPDRPRQGRLRDVPEVPCPPIDPERTPGRAPRINVPHGGPGSRVAVGAPPNQIPYIRPETGTRAGTAAAWL